MELLSYLTPAWEGDEKKSMLIFSELLYHAQLYRGINLVIILDEKEFSFPPRSDFNSTYILRENIF